MKIVPYTGLLIDKVRPQTFLSQFFDNSWTEALIMTCHSDHVQERKNCIQRVSNNDDAFVSMETNSADSLRIVSLDNPDGVIKSALSIKSHLLQLKIQRAPEITIRSGIYLCQSFKVSTEQCITRSGITCEDYLLLLVCFVGFQEGTLFLHWKRLGRR